MLRIFFFILGLFLILLSIYYLQTGLLDFSTRYGSKDDKEILRQSAASSWRSICWRCLITGIGILLGLLLCAIASVDLLLELYRQVGLLYLFHEVV